MRAPLIIALALSLACAGGREIEIGQDRCGTPGVDPLQLSALGPTDRSHWLQPWRAYLDTWPASRLRRAVGIGLRDDYVERGRLPALAESGLSRVIFEVQWSTMSFDDPTRLQSASRAELESKLRAARAAGMRPTLLLYGHEGHPTPLRRFKLRLTEDAPAGARLLKVDRTQLAQLEPGRSGLADISRYFASELMMTGVDPDGTVHLARPLPKLLAAGSHDVTTLRFAPWTRPRLPDGAPEPLFEETLQGWLAYVRAVADEAARVLGDPEFDLEIWNELVTGAAFLSADNYRESAGLPEDGVPVIAREILARTVRMLRDAGPVLSRVRVGNGFANTLWSYAGSIEEPGVAALNRHVSVGGHTFPQDAVTDDSRPLDARGRVAGTRGADGVWRDRFTPAYEAFFPELPLTAILPYKWRRPGQLIRDLAPLATIDANGVAHGRNTRPPGQDRPPAVWLTSISTRPKLPAEAPAGRTPADVQRFQAKAVMRSVAAYVSKGVEALFFYAPSGDLTLVNVDDPEGGDVMRALRRFRSAFDGPDEIVQRRQIELVTVRGCEGGAQFAGDGTDVHPPLLNRDVVAFFPFQVDEKRFVAATYVMTRDLMRAHREGPLTDVTRYDLPAESYDLVISGVAGETALVEAQDPLRGTSVEVVVKSRSSRRLTVSVPLTDSVRLLTIAEP